MIFVTIGTQEPFDRLIKTMDEIADAFPNEKIIAQVSETMYKVKHMQTFDFVSPTEFDKFFNEARLIVGHAGMGTIISALQKEKPIIVMPRIAKLGEHRNEHQMATAKKMEALNYIRVAYNEDELKNKVTSLLMIQDIKPLYKLGDSASEQLINSIKDFISKK